MVSTELRILAALLTESLLQPVKILQMQRVKELIIDQSLQTNVQLAEPGLNPAGLLQLPMTSVDRLWPAAKARAASGAAELKGAGGTGSQTTAGDGAVPIWGSSRFR